MLPPITDPPPSGPQEEKSREDVPPIAGPPPPKEEELSEEEKLCEADRERIDLAFDSLTEDQRKTLQRYACCRMPKALALFCGSDAEDLFHEAQFRTLDGTRHWNSETVDLVGHLIGCMRSISNDWFEKAKRNVELSEDTTKSPIDAETIQIDTEAKLMLEYLQRMLSHKELDPAKEVLSLIRKGYSRKEIIEMLQISAATYRDARDIIIRMVEERVARDTAEMPKRSKGNAEAAE